MFYFCTYFDYRYLSRGLSLYQSLTRYCPGFQLWILCLDSTCFNILFSLNLPEVHLISMEDFELNDVNLQLARKNRNLIEYYFTCTPSLPLYILNCWNHVDIITYIDADLFLFSNPEIAFLETDNWSVLIVPHRFPGYLKHFEKYGIYNVGWLTFRRDKEGLACLNLWREQCLDWCYDRLEDDRFADQKYLDSWASKFKGVKVLEHRGVNLAPWNLANHRLSYDGRQVWVDEQPLICFHFHKFKHLEKKTFVSGCADYQVKPSDVVRNYIFTPYAQCLMQSIDQVNLLLPNMAISDSTKDRLRLYSQLQNAPVTQWVVSMFGRYLPKSIAQHIERTLHYWEGLNTGEYIILPVDYP